MFDRNNRVFIDCNVDYIDLRAIHIDFISVIFYFVFHLLGRHRKCKTKRTGSKSGTEEREAKGGRRATEKRSW